MSKHRMRGPMGGGPMGGMGKGGEKAKDFKKTMKTLAKYLKPYSLSIIIVIIFAIGSAAFSIVGPKILGEATTEIFNGLVKKVTTTNAEGINFTRIGEIILFLVGLYLISVIFSLIQGWVMSGVAQKVSYNMRKEISEKINRMPLKYFDTKTHGEVLSRVTNDVDTVSQTLNQSLSQMLTAATTLIGVLIMMFSINWIMTLASLIVIPVSVGLIAVVVKKSQKYFKTQQEYLGYVNGQVEEVYSGHNVMKAFNAEEREVKKFTELNDTLYNSAWKSQFLSGMMMPIMTFVGNLGYVIVSILGGWLTIKNVIEVGDILAFVQYIRSFMQPISQTAQIANVLQSTAAAAERVFEFLDEEEEESIEIAELAYLGLGHIFRRPELPTPELYKRRLLLLHYFCDYFTDSIIEVFLSKYREDNILQARSLAIECLEKMQLSDMFYLEENATDFIDGDEQLSDACNGIETDPRLSEEEKANAALLHKVLYAYLKAKYKN